MIELNDEDIDKVVNDTVDAFRQDREGKGSFAYTAYTLCSKIELVSLCNKLIARLYDAEKEKKVKGKSSSDPDHIKCPSCGHTGIRWDREHDWYCPDCGNYVEYKD